jgi:DNA repair protein SbcC/Rad50
MRPHRLRVTAFGAFGGTVEVCFDDLASAGLFLLHGETGAGKTTLLDAIGFALYGRVPGERGKARRLRSDHAAPGTPTEVQLEATVGSRRMRITRKPEQQRPKRRGGGTTTEQAKILLEEADGATWRAVSTRAGEADDEIKDLMGMSAEQFYQVVLLPQGQFAQFLHADANDRQRLLQKLFGTDRFRAVEDWLADRRRVTTRSVEEATQAVKELAARVAQVGGASQTMAGDSAASPDEDPDPDALPDPGWAPRLAEAAGSAAAASRALVRARRAELDQAQDRQRGAERLADRQRRRADALRTRDQLLEAAPGLEELRDELGAARRGAEVAPALDEADRTAAVLADAHRVERQARAAVPQMPEAAAAELRAAAQQHVTRSGRLEELRSTERQAAAEDRAAASARADAADLAGQIAAAELEVAARH